MTDFPLPTLPGGALKTIDRGGESIFGDVIEGTQYEYEEGPSVSNKYRSFIDLLDGTYLMVPEGHTTFARYDPYAETVTQTVSHGLGNFAFSDGALADNGLVILAPNEANTLGEYDPSTDSYSDGLALPDSTISYIEAENNYDRRGDGNRVMMTTTDDSHFLLYNTETGPGVRQRSLPAPTYSSVLAEHDGNYETYFFSEGNDPSIFWDGYDDVITEEDSPDKPGRLQVDNAYGAPYSLSGQIPIDPKMAVSWREATDSVVLYTIKYDGRNYVGERQLYNPSNRTLDFVDATWDALGNIVLTPGSTDAIAHYEPTTNNALVDNQRHTATTNSPFFPNAFPTTDGRVLLPPDNADHIGIIQPKGYTQGTWDYTLGNNVTLKKFVTRENLRSADLHSYEVYFANNYEGTDNWSTVERTEGLRQPFEISYTNPSGDALDSVEVKLGIWSSDAEFQYHLLDTDNGNIENTANGDFFNLNASWDHELTFRYENDTMTMYEDGEVATDINGDEVRFDYSSSATYYPHMETLDYANAYDDNYVGAANCVARDLNPPFGDLYITNYNGEITSIKLDDGTIAWQTDSSVNNAKRSPGVAKGNNVVYSVSENDSGNDYLVEFDTLDGTEERAYQLDASLYVSPVYNNGDVYVVDNASSLYSIDTTASTLSLNWKKTFSNSTTSVPLVVDGSVYMVSDNAAFSIDASDGSVEWENSSLDLYFPSVAPAYYEGDIIFPSGTDLAYSLDSSNGDELWETSIDGNIRNPLAKDGNVYFSDPSTGRSIMQLSTSSGSVQWSNTDGFDGIVYGYFIHENTVYVGLFAGTLDGSAIAIDEADGSIKWQFDSNGGVVVPPVFNDGSVFAATDNGQLHRIDSSDGTEIYETGFGTNTSAVPAIQDKSLGDRPGRITKL